jgi:hypothetical protein
MGHVFADRQLETTVAVFAADLVLDPIGVAGADLAIIDVAPGKCRRGTRIERQQALVGERPCFRDRILLSADADVSKLVRQHERSYV